MAATTAGHVVKNVLLRATSATGLTTAKTSKALWTTGITNWATTPTPSAPPSVNQFYGVIVAAMVLSIICLVATLYVYCVIPDFRNVHGTILVSLCSCLLVVFVFLIVDLLQRDRVSDSGCLGIAIIIHVAFLASFFWINVMAYDVWRTIASLRPSRTLGSERRRYWKYSAYAWLTTAALAVPTIVLDNVSTIPVKYRPNFGTKRCWLNGTPSFLIYFNAPVGLILLSNLVMFVLAAKAIVSVRRRVSVLQLKKQKRRFSLYVKLCVVMGLAWFSEFLPWMTGVFQLYALAGFLTSLHGVYLFVIFVCKKKILRQLWYRCTGRKERLSKDPLRKMSSQMTELTEATTSSSRA